MGKQQNDLDKLYSAVSSQYNIGDLETFKSKMSTPEQRKSFYDKISAEGFDLGPYEVYEQRLGKSTEVSPTGLGNTSQGSEQPGQNISQQGQPLNQQSQGLSESSLVNPTSNQINSTIPAGTTDLTDPEKGIYAYFDPTLVNADTGQVGGDVVNLLEGVEVRPTDEQLKLAKERNEISNMESIKNTLGNMWNQIKSVPAQAAILFDQNARFDASRFLALYGATQLATGETPDQVRDRAYAYLDSVNAEMGETKGIISSAREGDLGGVAAGIVNAAGSLLSSLAIGASTGGAGTVINMVGDGVYSYNTKKAEELGITTEELFKQGKGDDIAPYITGSIASGLEFAGFKGVYSAINRNLTGSALRKAGLFAFDTGKEAATEWTQGGLEEYNSIIASGGTQAEAIEGMGRYMASEQGMEQAVQGLFGSMAASGGGRVIKGIVGKSAKDKAQSAQTAIEQIAKDYVNNPDPVVRQALTDAAVDASDQMLEATNESKKTVESLSPENRTKVLDNQSAIDTIDETLANGNLSEATVSALEQRKEVLSTEIDNTIKENETEQEVQPVVTEEVSEVSVESTEVQPVGETSGQAQELVEQTPTQNEEVVQEVVAPVAETGQQDQNVDVEPNEVNTSSTEVQSIQEVQTPVQEEIIDSTRQNNVNEEQENTVQENEQTPVREEAIEESTSRTEMPPREQTNPKLKRLLKALPRQDVEAMRGPANVGYRQDVIEAVTGKRPAKKDAGINAVKETLNQYFGLENAGSEASKNDAIRNWANDERTEFSSPDEAVRYQAENTDNPEDILRMYDQEQPVFNDRELRISEYLGEGRVNLKDYNRFGDYNNLDKNIVKNRIDETNSGIDLDVAAQELSDQLGYEITPDEIVDFVTNYPTVQDYNNSTKSENQTLLEKRYKELTGRNITEKVMDRFRGREAASVTDADLIASDPNMQELGVTADNVADRQQMESSEGLSPVSAPLPKSLLKGVSDRLKMTGLAKSVKVTDSKGVVEELGKRNAPVNFQDTGTELYHGGDLSNGPIDTLYLSPDRSEASRYADGNDGNVYRVNVSGLNIVDEADIMAIIQREGFVSKDSDWDISDLNLFEVIDPRFETSLSDGDLVRLNEVLDKEGIDGVRFMDTNLKSLKQDIENVAIFNSDKKNIKIDSDVNFQINQNTNGFNEGPRSDKDLFNSFEKMPVSEVLDVVSERTASPELKRVVDVLKNHLDRLSEFKLMTGEFPWRGLTENGRITINTDEVFSAPSDLTAKTGLDSALKTLVHEYIHAVTLAAYRNPKTKADRDFKSYVDKVYKELKSDAMFKNSMYGFVSETEFIAELMTNNEFRKLAPIQKRGVVGKVIDAIKKILGVKVETESEANARRNNLINKAFDDVLNTIPALSQQGSILYQKGSQINGFVDAEGNIVINEETAGLDTPIHEFAHIWEQTIERENPGLHARGMELIQTEEGKPYVDYVRQTQPGLEGRELYKEALAQAIGDSGARLISSQQRSVIKEWLKAAWDYIATRVGISGMTANQISNLSLREFTDAVAVDLLSGKPFVRMPNNDIVMETTAKSESAMNERQKFMSDFMLRMKAKNGVSFQGSIDGSLSAQDLNDLIRFFQYATEEGQITGIQDARDAAVAMGINSPAEVDMAYKLSQVQSQEATGFKKDQVSAETLKTADFEKMSDEEYREMGRQLVDSGQVKPAELVADIIANPRALQAWEVTALAYYRSQIDSQKADIQEVIMNGDQSAVDAYQFEAVDGEVLTGYKALAVQADLLNRRQFDLEVSMLSTANQQSAAFRLRSLMSDKDFNIVSYLAEMKATGYVNPELEARLKELSNELNEVKAKLKAKERSADKKINDISNSNINQEASRPEAKKVRNKKETVASVNSVLDTIDINSFGLPGMSFQTNGVVRFQTSPNNAVSQAVSDAIAKMKDNISNNVLSVSDAIEQAISDIDSTVGAGNWDSMKFRSTIANQLVQQSVPVKVKKPYVNSNGVLVIPGEYIKDLARNGNDTIDKMVSAASAELGGRFSDYDIQNAISGYGRQSGSKRTDLDKKISYAKRVARLLSQIEDLETKGKRLKTAKQVHENTTEINQLKENIKMLEYNIEMTPEERAQMDEIKYNEARRKYLNNYIAQLQERIDNKDFAPVKHENKYEDDAETRALRVEAERIKNEFKAEKYKHELENRSPWEKRKQLAYDIVFNITRAASAGADLSAIGVQGAVFSAARPRQAAKVFREALTKSYTEEQYDQYFAELQADPYYDIARKAGLNLQLPNFYQSVQEEQFKGSLPVWFIDKLIDPIAYATAKARGLDVQTTQEYAKDRFNAFKYADRNYSITLSKIRMDLFKEFLANQINKRGLDTKVDEAEVARLAEVVNTLTMASKVPGVQGKTANDIVSAIMFSARKFVATWKVLGGWVPLLIGQKRNFQLFKDAYGGIIARGLGTMFLTAALPTGIAALMYDDDEDEEPPYFYNPYFLDPRHSDFLKLKAGNTRISLFQGIDGNVVFATRQIMGEYMTSSSKAVRELNGEGFNKSRGTLAWDYISNKFAPTAAIAVGFAGSDREKQESYDRFQQSFAPMWATGIKEQYENTGNVYETGVLATLGIMGLSYNNYGGAEFAKSRGTDNKKAQSIYEKSGLATYDPAPGQRRYFDGEDVVKADGKFYKEKYLPEYQKFMTESVLSNQEKLEQKVNYEIKEGVVDQLKKEAYKYAEIKSSGVHIAQNFYSFSEDGTKYRILKSQYGLKADYIKKFMEREGKGLKREARVEVAQKLRKDRVKATDAYKEMLQDIFIYNQANKAANERMVRDMKRGKIKLIKQSEYFSDMDKPDWQEDSD